MLQASEQFLASARLRGLTEGNQEPDVAQSLSYYASAIANAQSLDVEQAGLSESLVAVDIWRTSLSDEHPEYGWGLQTLAQIQRLGGEPARALETIRRSMNVMLAQSEWEVGHPLFAYHQLELARCQEELGLLKDARVTVQKAYCIRKNAFGRDNDLVVLAEGLLGRILMKLRVRSARTHIASALEFWQGAPPVEFLELHHLLDR
jgi:hypothetical protein